MTQSKNILRVTCAKVPHGSDPSEPPDTTSDKAVESMCRILDSVNIAIDEANGMKWYFLSYLLGMVRYELLRKFK
jgi:hypothetical protein